MQQTMMMCTQENQIIQPGLATVTPVFNMMRIQKLLMVATWKLTMPVSRRQRLFQLGWYHPCVYDPH